MKCFARNYQRRKQHLKVTKDVSFLENINLPAADIQQKKLLLRETHSHRVHNATGP